MIEQLPPVLRAYVVAYQGVELLKSGVSEYHFPYVPFPAARTVRQLILTERRKCLRSLRFCTTEERRQVKVFIADLRSLAENINQLYLHCLPKEYDELMFVSLKLNNVPTKFRSVITDAYVQAYKDVLRGVREKLTPIRQSLAVCRYTAREMYPEHFGIPSLERRHIVLAEVTELAARHHFLQAAQ